MNLPPLHLLRTFDSAARHQSFKLAAEELHVTPSAVSHQIRQLEEFLGLPLFQRVNRGLRLSPAGQQYHEQVGAALKLLSQAGTNLQQRFGQPVLRANILPLMAAEVVIPALESFRSAHPDIQLRIETSIEVSDFASSEVDIGVRYGRGNWPGLESELLVPIVGTPVCSPAYARDMNLQTVEDVRRCNLIGLPMETRAWQLLAEQANMADFLPSHTLSMDNLLASARAAEQGLGLAIGVFPLMSPYLNSGRLVAPFDLWVQVPEGYHLVWRPRDSDRPEIQVFRDWIRELVSHMALPAGAPKVIESGEFHSS